MADAVLKDVMPQMEHPFYSLSKKPETSIRRYEHNGQWLPGDAKRQRARDDLRQGHPDLRISQDHGEAEERGSRSQSG
ncbi:MAG: replication initiator protein A, partial [Rhodocyclaceae bacterium]|nr:replication initiator protein A [Rhodocyclaceae bacterium]